MHIDLLMGMAAEVAGGHVASDDDHRNRVEASLSDTGGGVRKSGAEMRHEDAGNPAVLAAGIAVGGVRRDLLMAHRDVADIAVLEGVKETDHRVSAETEDIFHAA